MTKPIEQKEESYSLNIPASGVVTLTAPSSLGLLRGLATFQQMFYSCPAGVGGYSKPVRAGSLLSERATQSEKCKGKLFSVTGPLKIDDKPRFAWRGVSLDTSRNYYSIPAIQRASRAVQCKQGSLLMN